MYTIRPIKSTEQAWITSTTFHNLFSQLTTCTKLSDDQFQNWFDEIMNNPCATIFGVLNIPDNATFTDSPKIVGCGTLWILPKYYRTLGKSGNIEDIIISQEHQNKGLGKQLVKHIIDYAKNHECYKVQLHCSKELQEFYEDLSLEHKTQGMSMYFDDEKK